jgi:acetoacetyl-CoA synthetase
MGCHVGQNPTRATIEVLAPIWQRVLQRSSIRAEDNFFDLGGDPSSATKLFGEIARICGRELPPVTIFQAPTLASLAAVLQEPTTPRFPPLVQLKTGSSQPPVFIKHGLGGSVMEVFQVAKAIQTEHAIFGLQSKGFDGNDEPVARVEDMAQSHLEAIRRLQPRGPYALIGYSFGGLVMMEIAQRLQESGDNVALLAMLETYPHRGFLPLKTRLGLYTGLARAHAANVKRLPAREKLAYFTSRVARNRLGSRGDSGIASHTLENGLVGATGLERVRHSECLALKRYRPRFYKGKINFVESAKRSFLFPHDAGAIWEKMAEELAIDTVSGDHFGIVTTHCQELASVLSRYLAAAPFGD